MRNQNVGIKIARWSLIVAIIGLGVTVAVPELRKLVGFEKTSESIEFYTGTVLDSDQGTPIPNATVSLDIPGTPITIYTDEQGVYRFTLPPKVTSSNENNVKIRVQASGYEISSRNISITDKRVEEIRLTKSSPLSQSSSSPGTQVLPPSPPPQTAPPEKEALCQYSSLPVGSSANIKPAKTVFSPLDPIRASFSTSGIPKTYQRWLGVVEATVPDNTSLSYGWVVASENSPVSLPPQKPGDYQIRLRIRTKNTLVTVGYCPIIVQ